MQPHEQTRHDIFLAVALFGTTATIAAVAYSFGLEMPWLFDDGPNFESLKFISTGSPWSDYVFGGISSSIGRPISMASFLLNVADWPSNPAGFRKLNVAIHIINAGLLAALISKIAANTSTFKKTHATLGATIASLWLLHPFVASTVLSAVQRMVLLSATFTLLGLIGYVWGRLIVLHEPRRGLAIMSISLTLGSILGFFSKENGALLPLFAFALESCTLRNIAPLPRNFLNTTWQLIFFALPAATLAGYVAYSWQGHLATYAIRDFSPSQRIATESAILWDYIRQILAPDIAKMGWFHDDFPILSFPETLPLITSTVWIVIITIALRYRRSIPLLALAVVGYGVGHVLESTLLPLELYFEHRNYIPSSFVIVAVGLSLLTLPGNIGKLALFGITLVLSILLASLTSLWGQPLVAAQRWADLHPGSARAAQFAAQVYLSRGYRDVANSFIERAQYITPSASDLLVQLAVAKCPSNTSSQNHDLFAQLLDKLPTSSLSYAVFHGLSAFEDSFRAGECTGIDDTQLDELWLSLLKNKKFFMSALAKDHIYNVLARRASERRDYAAAERFQRAAYNETRSAENLTMIVVRLLEQQRIDDARSFLRTASERDAPSTPWQRERWVRQLSKIEKIFKAPTPQTDPTINPEINSPLKKAY